MSDEFMIRAEIMDMSFSLQFCALKYMKDNTAGLKPGIMKMPRELDDMIAERKLAAMGVRIDTLTPAQEKYLFGD